MKKYTNLFFISILVFSVLGFYRTSQAVEGPNNYRAVQGQEVKNVNDGFKAKREEVRKELEIKREEIKEKRAEIANEIKVRREEMKQKMETLREGLKQEKDQVKAKIKEARIEIREKALGIFDNIADRLSIAIEKVNTHITNLKAKGVDTTKAEEYVDIAEKKLDEAKTKITEVNGLLATSLDQLTAEDKAKIKTLKDEIQALYKETREALRSAVNSLKEAVKVSIEADTEDEVETENEVE